MSDNNLSDKIGKLKCPFCQDTLIPCIKNQNDWIYHCDNQKCPMYDDADNENAKHLLASEDLWQELIRTRKALGIAVDALKSAHKYYQNCVIREKQPHEINWYCTAMNMDNDISEALEQITALEQKE